MFLERDERTRGLEKTADGFFRLSIFFKTLPSFQNFGGKKILLFTVRQVTRKQTNEKHDEDNNEESKRRRRYC